MERQGAEPINKINLLKTTFGCELGNFDFGVAALLELYIKNNFALLGLKNTKVPF